MLVEIIPPEGTMTSAGQPKKEKTIAAKAAIVAREIIALIFWLYASLKLFIFDVDVFLVDKFVPEHRWLLDLKFFVLIGGVAIIWLLAGSKKFYLWFAYIFFYPLIIILWKIPYFVFRQRSWVFAFALINTAVSFFQSAKYNFIGSAVFLIAVAAIFNTSSTPLIGISVSAIFLLFTAVYIRRFIFVFKPTSIFQLYEKGFSWLRQYGVGVHETKAKVTVFPFKLDPQIKELPVERLDSKQLELWTNNLQNSVLYNRFCLFVAKCLF